MISALPALVSPCSANALVAIHGVMLCVFSLFGHHVYGHVAEGGGTQAYNRRLEQRTQQSTWGVIGDRALEQ